MSTRQNKIFRRIFLAIFVFFVISTLDFAWVKITYHVDKTIHQSTPYPEFIQKFNAFTVTNPCTVTIEYNLSSQPEDVQQYGIQCYYPNNGCPDDGYVKYQGHCYPSDITENRTKLAFSGLWLTTNGNLCGIILYTAEHTPEGDYHITGTITLTRKISPLTIHPTLKITVTRPDENTSWQLGKPGNVIWEKSGEMGTQVKIELYDYNGNYVRTLVPSTSNDGNHSFIVPKNIRRGMYKIRIATIDNAVHGDSKLFGIGVVPIHRLKKNK